MLTNTQFVGEDGGRSADAPGLIVLQGKKSPYLFRRLFDQPEAVGYHYSLRTACVVQLPRTVVHAKYGTRQHMAVLQKKDLNAKMAKMKFAAA